MHERRAARTPSTSVLGCLILSSTTLAFAACQAERDDDDVEIVQAAPNLPDTDASSSPAPADAGADAAEAAGDSAPPPPDREALDAGPPRLIEHIVVPSTTDPSVTAYDEHEYAYFDVRVVPRAKLVLLLADHQRLPRSTATMLRQVASYGHHALAVRHVNDHSVATLCATPGATDCHANVRLETLEGVDTSAQVSVPPQNAIERRLAKLLVHLASTHPGEGWSWYLDGSAPRWPAIVVAGQGQGAGDAAFVAYRRPTAGLAMFGGPSDDVGGAAAPWMTGPSLTSPTKMFGFVHVNDPEYAKVLASWSALGVPGTPTRVDGAAPPYGGSQQLTTSTPGAGHNAAGGRRSVIASRTSPIAPTGAFVYDPVWRTMFP